MKKIITGALFAVALSAPAMAADMAARPMYTKAAPLVQVYNWTGFYIGANVGYGGDKTEYPFNAPTIPLAGNLSLTSSGFFGGGQVGYNWQAGSWVFGLEADLQASNIESKLGVSVGPLALTAGTQLDWFGTARGRVGYAWNNLLLYVTGGYAFGRTDTSITGFGGGISEKNNKSGWVLGGGLEYGLTQNWSIKTEYQYIDLGADVLSSLSLPGLFTVSEDTKIHTVRAGVNYRF